jgi:hypothetical protein
MWYDSYFASNGATYGELFKRILKLIHNFVANLVPCHEVRYVTKVDVFIL